MIDNKTGMNLDRRIKRHVQGKTHTFFAVTAPGLEPLCRKELLALGLPAEALTVTQGGVLFQGRIHDCYQANLKLRTANRVLMRIASFTATNFRQLGKKLTALPWELFVYEDAPVQIRVSARQSRLYHTEAVAEQCEGAMARRWDAVGGGAGKGTDIARFPQQVFLRAVQDAFTLSIDSSGEMLYKRGLKTQGGRAPLRETTAAAVLAFAGYDGVEPLIDPMCGSGTFSLEAAMIADRIPAGFYRSFAFMGWPAFAPKRWHHIRRAAASEIVRRTEPVILAADKLRKSCEALSRMVSEQNLSGTISVVTKDFFDLSTTDLKDLRWGEKTGLIVMNPPYGRRLGTRQESETLFGEIGRKLQADFKGWKIALIVPKGHRPDSLPFSGKSRQLRHGGLTLTLVTGRIG